MVWEVLTEAVLFTALMKSFFTDEGEGNGEAEGAGRQERSRRCDIVKALLRDPLQNYDGYPFDLTWNHEDISRPPGALKRVHVQHPTLAACFESTHCCVDVSGLVPMVVWSYFLPMWGMFDGGHYNLRRGICSLFLGIFIWR